MSIVTIYNKRVNKQTREDELFRTVLEHDRIRWENQNAISVNGMTFMPDDNTTVYIPMEIRGYEKPKEYKSLTDITGKWTLQEGDIIVKGFIIDDNISQSELNKKYDEVRVIKSVDTNDFAKTTLLNHFEVIAK